MSEEENLDELQFSDAPEELPETADEVKELPEVSEEAAEDVKTAEAAPKMQKRKKYHTPLYIALITMLLGIMFFCGLQCFFNTSVNGTWGFTIKGEKSSDDIVCNLSFDDTQVRFQSSGTVYLGRLMIEDDNGNSLRDESGAPVMSIIMNVNNQPSVFRFNYEFEGNVFTGRKLMLTDLSGMFPDDSQSEKDPSKYKKIDDKEYRIWTLTPSVEDIKISLPKDFKEDKKLTGSWLLKSDTNAETFTWTFDNDGHFEHLNYNVDIHGVYTVKDGVCSISFMQFGNSQNDIIVKYKIEGDKLTIYQESEGVKLMEQVMTRVSDKNAFKNQNDK